MSDAEPFDLEPRVAPPRLPGEVIVRETPDDVFDALATDFHMHFLNCAGAFGSFHMALSGGSTPLPFYKQLLFDPQHRALPWDKAHLWIVDERRVPFEDEKSNYGALHGIFVEHSGMPKSHAHPMDPSRDDADIVYEADLVRELSARGRQRDRLDFVLLGMGDDAHTASLFPGSAPVSEKRRLVRMNDGPAVTPPPRITLTFPPINAARFVAVLVIGAKKRETIARVQRAFERERAASESLVREMPILGVRPMAGDLRWYLDAAACPDE
ncbi:MAG: 6-phosphogluconolactonase [Phycisphaerales bacterium]